MKKIIYIVVLSCISLCACDDKRQELMLNDMAKEIRHHITINDADKNLRTKIKYLTPLSYEELAEEDRQEANDAYRCKVHLVGTSSYQNSSRIYNMNDTLTCFFDKDIKFLRWDKKNE